jgi:putative transcriptional regulator
MTKGSKSTAGLDAALLEMAEDLGGTLLSPATAAKITKRILGENAPQKPAPLSPDDIKRVREAAGMSQAVFAGYLNLTTGYVSQLERGVKHPTGAALALLHLIRRKGMDVMT